MGTMNELKFNSQICTTKEQSQRLLEMGLKPETADMSYYKEEPCLDPYEEMECPYDGMVFPSWSLHRLIDLLPKIIRINSMQWYLSITPYYNDMVAYENCGNMESNYLYKSLYYNIYDNIINCIEWLIKENYFNKEYLKQ